MKFYPRIKSLSRLAIISSLAFIALSLEATAQTRTIRIVTYNIEDDVGVTTPLPGLIAPTTNTTAVQYGGVLEGIGEEIVGTDPAQPLDILALEETTSNPTTVTPIVNGLNAFYGVAGMYAMSSYQATESGGNPSTGNGPNALVYNTRTLQLLASVPVDPPGGTGQLGSSSGEYREVMRYEFAPAGQTPTSTNQFYVYVSHYKSGTTTSDMSSRNGEAGIIRNDAANNLPANARVVYVGDFNVDTSGEAMYQTLLAANAPNGIHQGQGFDPLNVTNNPNINWESTTTNKSILIMLTEEDYEMRYRDDLQLSTSNVFFAVPGGLCLVTNTYHTFGNNGSLAYGSPVTGAGNTALTNLATGSRISAAQLFLDLTNASDHLPVVADYTVPIIIPAPVISSIQFSATNLALTVSNAYGNFTYTLIQSTNLQSPRATWTPVATNYPPAGGSFVFSLTNLAASPAFYSVTVH